MNRFLISALASIAALTGATCVKAADAIVIVDEKTFDWSGFYVGAQLGYLDTSIGFDFTSFASPYLTPDATGVVGGIFAGYNFVAAKSGTSSWVYGVEGEYNFSNADGLDSWVVGGGPTQVGGGQDDFYTTVNATAAIRARVGYAMDNTMLYVAPGVAWIDYDIRVEDLVDSNNNLTNSYSSFGWTIGGGVEHAFSEHLVGRIDYRYSDFGEQIADGLDQSVSSSEIKAGVAVHF